MNIITLEESAFYELVNKVIAQVRAENQGRQDKWIDGAEAMRMLRITSKTTLQKLRDEGKIRFSKTMTKIILYDSESILKYIESHAKEPF